MHDPPLSDLGVSQCAALREKLQSEYSDLKPEDVAIIASPMRRTLQTAMLGLGWLIERGVKAEANADWQGIYSPHSSHLLSYNLILSYPSP
ncbi:MAG: histidine phosphatase family protein [Propionibacteriaceae bacterium]|nr:histidine phosphatase family protein [Propionibacteriaceae bacterium]